MNIHNLIPGLLEHCLRAPEPKFDERKIQVFENLFQTACRGDGVVAIDYNCEFPKYEFLSYLVENKNILLHGSNEKELNYLIPLRRSSDLRQVGNLDAVYACSDGIWPIFFAIWERRYHGATSNSCFWAKDADGTRRRFYGFSIAAERQNRAGAEAGHRSCWTNGMVYLLPRDPFTRLVDDAGNLLEEWASTEPVPVLAKLPVVPQDFLFLDQVSIREEGLPPRSLQRLKVDSSVYDTYAGAYEVSPDLVLNLIRKNDRLLVQAVGFPIIEMHPQSETDYLLREINGQITFVKNDKGEAIQLKLLINGTGLTARKIS